MSNIDVIRAWKDEEYRLGLSKAELDLLPAHPAGPIEISNDDLRGVNVPTVSEVLVVCTGIPVLCR